MFSGSVFLICRSHCSSGGQIQRHRSLSIKIKPRSWGVKSGGGSLVEPDRGWTEGVGQEASRMGDLSRCWTEISGAVNVGGWAVGVVTGVEVVCEVASYGEVFWSGIIVRIASSHHVYHTLFPVVVSIGVGHDASVSVLGEVFLSQSLKIHCDALCAQLPRLAVERFSEFLPSSRPVEKTELN